MSAPDGETDPSAAADRTACYSTMSARPPKLLFLAYPFPPARAIGAVRCWNIARHLAQRGWQVEVVTVDPRALANPEPNLDLAEDCRRAGLRLRETPPPARLLGGGWFRLRWWQPRPLARLLRRATTVLGIDPAERWASLAVARCADLPLGSVDVVLASGSPFCAFAAASRLARRLATGLVLDYRDLWTGNPHFPPRSRARIRRREQRALSAAHGITVVSPSMAESLRADFQPDAPVEVVTNGFDPEEFSSLAPEVFPEAAVVYAGRFYPPRSTAEPLIAALGQANAGRRERPVRFHYFGPDRAHVEELAARHQAADWVVCRGSRPRREVLAALRGAAAAAVITLVTPAGTVAERGILTGKLFEALGAGTRVLLVAPEDSDATRLVREHGVGAAFPGDRVREIARWLAGLAGVPSANPPVSPAAFSWPHLAARLDAFLRSAASP